MTDEESDEDDSEMTEEVAEALRVKVDYMVKELNTAKKALKRGQFSKARITLGGIDTDCDLCQEEIDIAIDNTKSSEKVCKSAGKKQCSILVDSSVHHIDSFIKELKDIV